MTLAKAYHLTRVNSQRVVDEQEGPCALEQVHDFEWLVFTIIEDAHVFLAESVVWNWYIIIDFFDVNYATAFVTLLIKVSEENTTVFCTPLGLRVSLHRYQNPSRNFKFLRL